MLKKYILHWNINSQLKNMKLQTKQLYGHSERICNRQFHDLQINQQARSELEETDIRAK